MAASLIQVVTDQPLVRVIRAFLRSSHPRYLRELCLICELSPGGVSDILRRLKKAGLLRETREKNRKCYTLDTSEQEQRVFVELFSLYEKMKLQQRASKYSKRAGQRLEAMDETYAFYRKVKEGLK